MTTEKRYALVIGASGGLGKGFSMSLKKKFKVIGTYHTNPIPGTYKLDLENTKSIHALVRKLREMGIKIDLVVHAAGMFSDKKLIESTSEEIHQILTVNVIGFHIFFKELLPLLKEDATIILCNSDAGLSFQPGHPLYSLSKWLIESYADNLTYECPTLKIVVAEFGNIDTGFAGFELEGGMDPKVAVHKVLSAIDGNLKVGINRAFIGTNQELEYTISDVFERLTELKRHLDKDQLHTFKKTINFFWDMLME